jgi:Ca2+-binding RTX toxin-like protein
VLGGKGNERFLAGGAGNDVIRGGWGRDLWTSGTVQGGFANDRGNDRHYGGRGSDRIEDLAGVDRLYGGDGDDGCLAAFDNDGADFLNGGRGIDIWYTESADTRIALERRVRCFAP